jgi:hypothetical protein
MIDKKMMLDDEQLEQVVGGLFVFHKKSRYVTFTHQDGTVTDHNILDYDKAWERCMSLEAANWDEDKIFQDLINKGYIEASVRN